MRIRKNRKISSGIEGHQNPHLCLFNQSPWDVISFSPDLDFDFQSCLQQFGRDSRFNTNSNSSDSAHSTNRMVNNREAEAVERITAEKGKKVLGDDEEKRIKRFDNHQSNKNEQVESSIPESRFVESCPKINDSGCDGDKKGVTGLRRSQRRAAKKYPL